MKNNQRLTPTSTPDLVSTTFCQALGRNTHILIASHISFNLNFIDFEINSLLTVVGLIVFDVFIGPQLLLRCERHPTEVIHVSKASHFNRIPQGGCTLPCQTLMECGHKCPQICHATDENHALFKCQEPCLRSLLVLHF